ncbi:hypothetical protein A2524_02175 [Candidatus Wolfebacteria bacterium RIFOXYD12_FULL_48_21]|uniref:General secretion pathway GspH domain-containing protein n=1 Tax=Candidatus Wolfebacteria bacterium RIFOXYD1_FULL_48_65 TaxID=1802561 RepID=A0A1F8E4B6_9BACT|nr:MAG: hypothetical protein A2524_02175 [Candidatus Wolfebacteria bacterium RIFOXYD12_FULL_48_21]OGM95530.1 MAG: hypothetical protein A2610_01970 [Candidatus Wolfebacteria bacterium RIFOXYD1_FULL_48_65]OGM96059.1 MAG: hypothetical protein A2532_00555 [Candidatus Wolfebacteria bacterium RIFOXYD2_FULL_48_11]
MSTVKKIQYKKGLHASPGMSLIELVIVMGIFIVLVTSIRFFPIDFFYAQSLSDDATKIAFTLRGTRDRAVAQDSESMWGVHFVNEATGTDYYQVFMGDTFASGAVVERVNLNETVQFTAPPSASSTDVLFSKLSGLPTGSGSLIISLISDPTKTKTITILGNGQVDY